MTEKLDRVRAWLRDTEEGRVVVREAARSFLEKGCLSEILDSSPPHDLQIECRLIGMFIIHPKTIGELANVINPGNFHDRRNGRLYEHLLNMWAGGTGGVDVMLLMARLKEHGEVERVGDTVYLAELMDCCGMPSLAKHYATVLLDHAIRRSIIHTADRMLVHAYGARMPVLELIEKTRLALDMAAEGTT